MSAKDKLDTFDREWAEHIEWRTGERVGWMQGNGAVPDAAPGQYLSGNRYGEIEIRTKYLPQKVRDGLVADIEAVIGAAIDARKQAIRAELVSAAKEEARATLAEIGE